MTRGGNTEESLDASLGAWLDLERRPLLKALGGGAALSLAGGIAAASGDEAADDGPGDASGQGVGDAWWVLGPDGTPIRSTSDE